MTEELPRLGTGDDMQVHLLNDERGPVIETLIARTQRQVRKYRIWRALHQVESQHAMLHNQFLPPHLCWL